MQNKFRYGRSQQKIVWLVFYIVPDFNLGSILAKPNMPNKGQIMCEIKPAL